MKITVLLGGSSAERDVSLASGLRMALALRERGHAVRAVDPAVGPVDLDALRRGVGAEPPTPEALAELRERRVEETLLTMPAVRDADVVVLGLHGGRGEDGTLQALLDLAGIRYTGSGPLGSALAMDKELSKQLFRAAEVRTADWLMVRAGDEARWRTPAAAGEVGLALRYPVVVKPSKQGSTVGLTVVKRPEDLAAAITLAFRYDDEVMLERFVPGREFTVGILGGVALPVGEIIPQKEIYDYECKYTPGMAVEVFPAQLDAGLTAELQEQARRAFAALKLRGCARIDFRLTPDGTSYCLEANTLPGMTETSLIPQAAAAAGLTFGELCERLVQLAAGDAPAVPAGAAGAASGAGATPGAPAEAAR